MKLTKYLKSNDEPTLLDPKHQHEPNEKECRIIKTARKCSSGVLSLVDMTQSNIDNLDKLVTIFCSLDKLRCPHHLWTKHGKYKAQKLIGELKEVR